MELVNLGLKQGADIFANGIRDVEALGPSDEGALVDAELLHGEAESEAQAEDVLIAVALRCANCLATSDVRCKVLFVVLLEEGFDLLGKKSKEVFGLLGNHKLLGNGNLVVGEVESGVAVEVDRADAKVSAAKIDCKVQSLYVELSVCLMLHRKNISYLLCSIGNTSDIGRDLAHARALFL